MTIEEMRAEWSRWTYEDGESYADDRSSLPSVFEFEQRSKQEALDFLHGFMESYEVDIIDLFERWASAHELMEEQSPEKAANRVKRLREEMEPLLAASKE